MPKAKTKSTKSNFTDPTKKVEVHIPRQDITTAYQQVLLETAKQSELKGFRKGKAPLNIVEQSTDKNKLYEKVFQRVFPNAYVEAIKKAGLKPVAPPRIQVKDAKTDGDWVIEAEVAEKPTVDLKNYQDALKSKFAKEKIWVPGKDEKKDDKGKSREKLLQEIFDVLFETVQVDISLILIEDEANRSLSRLLEQINKLGLSLEQYVASLNKSVDDLKKEHLSTALTTLKLEYTLEAIGQEQKLAASDSEFTRFLTSVTDANTKKRLSEDKSLEEAIRFNLTKQKVIDYLLTIATS